MAPTAEQPDLITTGFITTHVSTGAGGDEVFIIDGTRLDGSDFIVSVSALSSLEPCRLRHEIETGVVTHWKRDGRKFNYADGRSARDWRQVERFNL